ncbi:putative cell division control protein [Trypanosoma grayi]|uniref:putative cell division control protein n=1 Tax=Trypanosoma grayi TaxID=71804 RepID=UPI0004F42CA5|nr:putative cell division control protein [Trypanosoma grayi]KEG15067.1 putative cell division control protein [Trypanosoma grayi]
MSRMRFKGGAWTNSEDEVLRASLTVYGLQNWERVASMLVRKTAAQCRERWESYLDPRLHIHEAWTAAEEEQLVQLQSLFANQWNLIARELRHRTGMNRPVWLCEEHYHALLDALEYERQRKDGGSIRNESMTLDDFLAERRRHRGAHQGHETRAARPDAVNSEVFEKEMVEFAVSRLANQDGKKGLRRERKKQLEHTSFLAKLQSNREAIESGTLSANAKKRMERAMLEDLAGPSDTRLRDDTVEDNDNDEDKGDNDVEVDKTTRRRQQGAFQPIDLGADKKEAGIQAKQRVLVKDLSGSEAHQQQERGAAADGVNVELLRLASGLPTTGDRQLEGKKSSLLLASIGSASNIDKKSTNISSSGHIDQGDLDSLFASLPGVVTATRETDVQKNTFADDLFIGLPAPEPVSNSRSSSSSVAEQVAVVNNDVVKVAEESPATEEEEEEEEGPLDFTTPAGHMWLREAKRRVALEAERAFIGRKRARRTSRDGATQRRSLSVESSDDVRKVDDYREEEKKAVEEDPSMQHVVHALVESQLPATMRQLLGEGRQQGDGEPVAKKMRGSGSNNKDGGEKDEGGEDVAELRARLAAGVAAAQQQDGGEFWRSVSATEATMQLEELVHHQREQVVAVTAAAAAAQQRVERIVRVCFARQMPHLQEGGDDVVQHACDYWGAQLRDAQRQLAFYTAVREAERQEMQQRIDEATHRLAGVEQRERTLQELYRATRPGHNAAATL